jgi:hypothetical protein
MRAATEGTTYCGELAKRSKRGKAKYDLSWLVKPFVTLALDEDTKAYIFPEDRLVALKRVSANGYVKWFEELVHFEDAIWERVLDTSRFELNPLTALKEEQAKVDKANRFLKP